MADKKTFPIAPGTHTRLRGYLTEMARLEQLVQTTVSTAAEQQGNIGMFIFDGVDFVDGTPVVVYRDVEAAPASGDQP